MTNKLRITGIPEPSLRRYPVYHSYLKKMEENSIEYVSCTKIAAELNQLPIQIRKDLSYTGISGKPKIGYEVKDLIHHLEDCLGWNNLTDAVLVGAGNLGSALLGFEGFQQCGLNITAAFDIAPDKIGKTIGQKKVLNVSKMPDLVKRMKIKIGILTVAEQVSQETADLMVAGGIEAIWNFSPSKLQVPDHVIVQHENLAASLAILSASLKNKGRQQTENLVGGNRNDSKKI